ncbi:anti-sigma regulatory factor [Deltaproteobacteria bacterium TL4]
MFKVIFRESIYVNESRDSLKAKELIRKHADELGLRRTKRTKMITASSEIIRNMLLFAGGGKITLEQIVSETKEGLRLIFRDQGPGIENGEQALLKGFSTIGNDGVGLSVAKNLVDEFTIYSTLGRGTKVILVDWKVDERRHGRSTKESTVLPNKLDEYPKQRKSEIIAPSQTTAYIIVHPDDFALQVGNLLRLTPDQYKEQLKIKVRNLLDQKIFIVVMNLERDIVDPPNFLMEFKNRLFIIPTHKEDDPDSQANRLRQYLIELKGLHQVIFTGGWKHACLMHTVNHTIETKNKIFFKEKIKSPFQGTIFAKHKSKEVWGSIDLDFVF